MHSKYLLPSLPLLVFYKLVKNRKHVPLYYIQETKQSALHVVKKLIIIVVINNMAKTKTIWTNGKKSRFEIRDNSPISFLEDRRFSRNIQRE